MAEEIKKFFTVKCDSEKSLVWIQDVNTGLIIFLNFNNISHFEIGENFISIDSKILTTTAGYLDSNLKSSEDEINKFNQLKTIILYHMKYLMETESRLEKMINNIKI